MNKLHTQNKPAMNNSNSKHKGFTLIEASVVLVIIGIILTLVIGFRQIHRSAKVRVLAAKPLKISNAINSFYDMYSRYPGDNKTTAFGYITEVNNSDMWFELINSGLLSLSDISITRTEYSGFNYSYDLRFASITCATPESSLLIYGRFVTQNIKTKRKGCIGLIVLYDLTSYQNTQLSISYFTGYTPVSLIAGYEIYYDDLDVQTGLGRTDSTDTGTNFTVPFRDALFAPGTLKDYKSLSNVNMRISIDRYYFVTQDRY